MGKQPFAHGDVHALLARFEGRQGRGEDRGSGRGLLQDGGMGGGGRHGHAQVLQGLDVAVQGVGGHAMRLKTIVALDTWIRASRGKGAGIMEWDGLCLKWAMCLLRLGGMDDR